jgi:hypothetical protein
LWTFKNQAAIGLHTGLVDTSDRGDEPLGPHGGCVVTGFHTEILREPGVNPPNAVPTQPVEVVAHRMNPPVPCDSLDGLTSYVGRNENPLML